MGAGHAHAMYVHRHSPVHHLAPETKVVAALAFTIVVVATPRERVIAFGAYALLVLVLAIIARVPALWLAKRSLIELPFVATALLLPFFATGPKVDFLGSFPCCGWPLGRLEHPHQGHARRVDSTPARGDHVRSRPVWLASTGSGRRRRSPR